MKSRVAILALALFVLSCNAAQRAGAEDDVAADMALWNGAPLLEGSYEEPPASWHRIENPEMRLSFAMPCEPEFKREADKGTVYLTYQCIAAGNPYIVLVMNIGSPAAKGDAGDRWLSTLYLGHVAASDRRAQKMHLDIEVLRDHRILYQGVAGRQSVVVTRMNGKTAVVTTRLLAGSRATISLKAGSSSRKPTQEMQQFFSSLKIR